MTNQTNARIERIKGLGDPVAYSRYIYRIRNPRKRQYAQDYWKWLTDGKKGDEPTYVTGSDAKPLTSGQLKAVRDILEACYPAWRQWTDEILQVAREREAEQEAFRQRAESKAASLKSTTSSNALSNHKGEYMNEPSAAGG